MNDRGKDDGSMIVLGNPSEVTSEEVSGVYKSMLARSMCAKLGLLMNSNESTGDSAVDYDYDIKIRFKEQDDVHPTVTKELDINGVKFKSYHKEQK